MHMKVRTIIILLCLLLIETIQAQLPYNYRMKDNLVYKNDTLFTGTLTHDINKERQIRGKDRVLLQTATQEYKNGVCTWSQLYYKNGQLCEEYNSEEGTYRLYSEDGTLEYSETYSEDDDSFYTEQFGVLYSDYHGRGKFFSKGKYDAKRNRKGLWETFFDDGRILSGMDIYTENEYDYQEYTDEYKDEYKYGGLGFTTERYRLKEDYRYGKDSLLLEKDIETPDSLIHEYYEKGRLVKRDSKERYLLYSPDGTIKDRQKLLRIRYGTPEAPFPKELSDQWQIIDRAINKLSALEQERGRYLPEDTLALTEKERAAIKESYIDAYGTSVFPEQSPYDLTSHGADSWRDSNGGPYKVTATSTLDDKKYPSMNMMDKRLDKAWVEGANGYGIGEKITFYFANHSPRVTLIGIHNGYTKTDRTWIENTRVKELKVYVNNIPYMLLELADNWQGQSFLLPEPLGRFPIDKCSIDNDSEVSEGIANFRVWTLTLEIMSVYPGEKYDDTAISEIGFMGIDAAAYCIAEGALIACPDGSGIKKIETLTVGDEVYCYDTDSQTTGISKIKTIQMVSHDYLLHISTQKSMLSLTEGHPVYIDKKGWCSINPAQTSQSYPSFGHVSRYQEGDYVLIINNNLSIPQRIERIEPVHQQTNTYYIELENGNAIIAEGMVVGAAK